MPSFETSSDLLAFAVRLAEAGGAAAMRHYRTALAIEDKDAEIAETGVSINPVTAGDREAEATIRQIIAAEYPDHGIIGEEYGADRPDAEHVWILDPIDGTRAFVLGLPIWGVLVGLKRAGKPLVGAMAQPHVGDVFFGSAEGSFLKTPAGTRALATRSCRTLAKAAIATTTPALFSAAERPHYDAIEAECGLVRYGTDCYGYGCIAAGYADIVIESGLETYDIAALIPIVEGAGGRVTDWRGGSCAEGGQILATGDPALHEQLVDRLKTAAK